MGSAGEEARNASGLDSNRNEVRTRVQQHVKEIEETADLHAFMLHNLGVVPKF
ncbi:MAG TPA: hypothetical protein VL126_10250 [Bacteroidota bacterium]|nr:hypothetical protein [Bacteroidota bacterium]